MKFVPDTIDVSENQGRMNFKKAEDEGITTAYIRCTQGDWDLDERFEENWDNARLTSMKLAPYFVILPAKIWSGRWIPISSKAHIAWFLEHFGDRTPDVPVLMDCEKDFGQSQNWITTLIENCCERMYGKWGFKYHEIYTRKTWWDRYVLRSSRWSNHPLMVAHYNEYIEKPWIPRDWVDYNKWQYTSKGEGPKYGASSPYIDLSMVNPEQVVTPPEPEPVDTVWAVVEAGGKNYEGELLRVS